LSAAPSVTPRGAEDGGEGGLINLTLGDSLAFGMIQSGHYSGEIDQTVLWSEMKVTLKGDEVHTCTEDPERCGLTPPRMKVLQESQTKKSYCW